MRPTNPLRGTPLTRLADHGISSDLRVTAIKRKDGTTIVPKGQDFIIEGDEVFVIGSRESTSQLLELSGVSLNQKIRRVIIVGAERIGLSLAQALEKSGTQVKMIEADREKAETASTILRKTTVLHGDYLSPGFLEEAGVDGVDGFVSVTGADENDVMACVTAKQHGANRVLALVQKPRYLPILENIPTLDAAVSRHLTAVSNILRLVRRGQIVSAASLREIDAEVIELVAGPNSQITYNEIQHLRGMLPDDVLIGAIVRQNRVLIPIGKSVIQAGDRVIIFTMPDSIPVVEKLFVEPKMKRFLGQKRK